MGSDLGGQFAAIHAGHDDIGEQKIDRALMAGDDLQSGGAIFGFENFVALRFQILAGEAAEIGLVFDEENGFLAAIGAGKAESLLCGEQPLRGHRRAENRRGKRCRAAAGCRQRCKPPLCFTMPYTVESPSPVPLAPLVVKKGSKMRD